MDGNDCKKQANKRVKLPILRCHGPCMRTSPATSARRLRANR